MEDCKIQILNSISNKNCCSQAFINALVSTSAQIDKLDNFILFSADDLVLEKTTKIILNSYPTITLSRWDDFLLLQGNIFSVLNDINYREPATLLSLTNECDKLTYLKTLFLICGRFYYKQDDKQNSTGYNLEIVLKNDDIAELCLQILKEFNFNFKKIKRYNNFVLYTKNSNIICDLFVKLGAQYTSLEIQNNLAMRELRNSANRQNNCFEFNLNKTLLASNIQLEAINYILNNYSIDYLDENLRDVALARIANPDISLKDLQIILNNKLSRAGIKYRLDKIIEIYKKLKGED